MTRTRRLSPQTLKVLNALAASPSTWRYGYELGAEVGLRSGSLYPILVRLSDRGLLEAQWEESSGAGRPPRHMYRLPAEGLEHAAAPRARASAKRRGQPRPQLRGAS